MRDKNHAFGSLLGVSVFLLSLHASDASAFGKNKVITEDPRWQVRATRHFDIHFTPDAAAIVPRAAYYLENAYERITRDLDIRIEGRTPFFLFSDHNRFEENNIADVGEGTGGVTEAFKNRFFVFNNGTEEWLDHVITHEFGHVAEFEILYGGFWKSIRLLKSPLYPLWLMEGYAEYVVGDMDKAEEDLVLRDAATSGGLIPLGELHGFNHLKPNQVVQAYKQGAAAVRYLAREYGPESVANLLKSLRDRFEPGSLLADFTGLDFAAFDRRYREFLTDHYTAQSEGWLEPEAYGDRTSPPDLLPVFNTNPVFSPDGLRAAYLSDASGERQVMIADLDTGARRALAGRQWGKLEHIHGQRLDEGRALSFSPDGRWLAFAGEKKQRDYLYLYDLKRDRLRRLRPPFEQIRSPVFHPRGDRLAVVGLRNGTNDLYEVTTRGKLIRRLTESPADENDPAYSPDGETLVYSQEVFVSSAAEQGAGDPFAFRHPRIPPAPRPERDLMRLDLATLAVSPLTDMPGDEVSPAFTPDGASLLFVGSPDDVYNLYKLDLPSGAVVRLTQVVTGVFSPDVSRDGRSLLFSAQRGGSRHVYRGDSSLWASLAAVPAAALPPAPAKAAPRASPPGPERDAAPEPPAFAAAPPRGPLPTSDDLFITDRSPYRFRASTDLFFPVFYYSSSDGLFAAAFWQASEYLGNHQVQTSVQYASGDRFLDYGLQYAYRRFRPQLLLGAEGKNFYRDFARTELRREADLFAGVSYPLDRFHRLEGVFTTIFRRDEFKKIGRSSEERENVAALALARDTTTGRYLAVTGGDRFRAAYQISRPVLAGDKSYDSYVAEYHRFTPTGRESALAFRGLAGASDGETPQSYRLGGADRVRGFTRNADENKAEKFALGNLEWRVPMKYLDYYTWFLFPDFSFKAIYGALFTDAGYAWPQRPEERQPSRLRHSVGAGVRIPTFILQTYSVTLSVDAARRTDADDWIFYFSLGPEF